MAGPLRSRVLIAAAAGAIATGCGVALLAVSGFLLARASQHPNIAALSVAVVAVRALSLGRGVSRYGERLASHDVAFRVLARVRVATWRRLEALAPAGLPGFHSGDLLSRLVADVDATQDLFVRGFTPVLAAVLVGSGAVLTCVMLLGQAGLILGIGLVAGGLAVPVICVAAAAMASRQVAPTRGQLGSAVADVLAGAADLDAYGANDLGLARTSAAGGELTRLAGRAAVAEGLSTGLSALVAGLTVWGVLLLGVVAVGAGAAGRVPLAAGTLTALAAFEAVSVLPGAVVALSRARTAADRITELIDSPEPVADPVRPRPLPGGEVVVSLRDAQVRHVPGGPLAIDGISLDLTPGRRIALVGPNGAGKSTVAAVLLRFVELAGGSATLNSLDLAAYRGDDVRSVIGGCPQDPHLFDASLGENLRIARPSASDADLLDVTRQAGLSGWIESLPAGLRTQVGREGAAVSGGQRQRIALARALLINPRVLILDEPAAHLDRETASSLIRDLLAATSGRATLLITHDLSGLDEVDEIIVLDRGKVAERGTHGQLLAAAGLYYELWHAAQLADAASKLPPPQPSPCLPASQPSPCLPASQPSPCLPASQPSPCLPASQPPAARSLLSDSA